MSNPHFINFQDLHRNFQMGGETVHALDGVSTFIDVGEFVAIMGPSGSGKSTLLYMLGGLDQPSNGRIWVNDQEITALDEDGLAHFRRNSIGFVFQSFNLIPTMTAAKNVEFPMIFSGVRPKEREIRAKKMLELVGLGDRLHHKPTELSGGQQQRVSIARSLVNNPPIVLADEPTGNLDSKSGGEIIRILRQMNQEEGRTVILVTHDPAVAERADRIIRLKDGKIV